jgi:hypothetical protein
MIYKLPEKLVRPSRRKWFVFTIPDVHRGYHAGIPGHDPLVWDVGMQALRHFRNRITHVVILGDFGGFESVSHWASLRAEHIFLDEDLAITNYGLDEIDKICTPRTKKIYIEGNHEHWATLLEAKYPTFRNQVNLRRRLLAGRPHWTWVPNNHFFKLGKAYFTHGNYPGASSAHAMLKETGKSVLYGHTHGQEVAYFNNLSGLHMAMSNGCWCMIDPPPPYSQAKIPSRWVHGFTPVQIRANGLFQAHFHRIIERSYVELMDGTELIADRSAVEQRMEAEYGILRALHEQYNERDYVPGGAVHDPEPLGRSEYSSRQRRARVIQKAR